MTTSRRSCFVTVSSRRPSTKSVRPKQFESSKCEVFCPDRVGDPAMHRGFLPTERELRIALDLVEGALAPIFGHSVEAQHITTRIPPQKQTPTRGDLRHLH